MREISEIHVGIWGPVCVDGIREVLPMINDFMMVISFAMFLLQKLVEIIPPRLLEVKRILKRYSRTIKIMIGRPQGRVIPCGLLINCKRFI